MFILGKGLVYFMKMVNLYINFIDSARIFNMEVVLLYIT